MTTPSALESRVLGNTRKAAELRAKYRRGYAADSTFSKLLDVLTDAEIIQNWLDSERAKFFHQGGSNPQKGFSY